MCIHHVYVRVCECVEGYIRTIYTLKVVLQLSNQQSCVYKGEQYRQGFGFAPIFWWGSLPIARALIMLASLIDYIVGRVSLKGQFTDPKEGACLNRIWLTSLRERLFLVSITHCARLHSWSIVQHYSLEEKIYLSHT